MAAFPTEEAILASDDPVQLGSPRHEIVWFLYDKDAARIELKFRDKSSGDVCCYRFDGVTLDYFPIVDTGLLYVLHALQRQWDVPRALQVFTDANGHPESTVFFAARVTVVP